VTRYRQDVEDLIDFVFDSSTFTSSYQNRSRVRLAGWEGELRLAVTGRVGIEGSLTAMEAVDEFADEDLPRRPDLSYSLGGTWQPRSGLAAALRLRRVGVRTDIDFTDPFNPVPVELDPVMIFDGEVSWRLADPLLLRFRVRNLTDASPVWVWGYGSLGRAVHFGVVLGG
jgi:outer membrane cobalamin receptor